MTKRQHLLTNSLQLTHYPKCEKTNLCCSWLWIDADTELNQKNRTFVCCHGLRTGYDSDNHSLPCFSASCCCGSGDVSVLFLWCLFDACCLCDSAPSGAKEAQLNTRTTWDWGQAYFIINNFKRTRNEGLRTKNGEEDNINCETNIK